ncbi:MAG TPA: CHRD domain-containing protein [Thermoanaerobaculia bacterium]|nr:CHRD domain-containing protein [Thermoanaerobaculia bacterium]
MSRKGLQVSVLVVAAVALSLPAWGQTGSARLRAFEEVPAISSNADGAITIRLNNAGTSLSYQLSYEGLQGAVTQAHIHIGQRGVNGGIMIFLCSNLGNGPAGTQACPASPATITGTATAADVVGPGAQGITAGQFGEVLRAMRNGVTYANVHTDLFPGGEIRGQLRFGRGGGNDGLTAEDEAAEDHIHH